MGFIGRLLDIGNDAVETSRGCGRQRGKRRGIGTEEDAGGKEKKRVRGRLKKREGLGLKRTIAKRNVAMNHGMKSSFQDKVRQVSKQFFQLLKEEKQKCAREREPNNIEGYGNDIIYSKNQRLDWTDRVYLKVLPEDQRKFKFWPQNPNDFRNIVLQYTECIRLLSEVIIKATTKLLNLEEDCFLNECGERELLCF
ncbi:hypothetical protein JHK87_039746 [Glycine soja]|nr:hypothetical protein JHK87_039746 [Glycine soja]